MGAEATQATWKKVVWYVVLTTLTLVVLFPVYMTLVRALSTPAAYVREGQPLYPVDVQWDVFRRAWDQGDLGRKVGISAIVTAVIVTLQLTTSLLAAYAFTFLQFPGRRILFVVFMATLMLPIEVTLIPNVQTIRDLDWLNSFAGLTAPFLATAFGTFLIRQGFMGIPRDLKDASQLDGFGHMAFLRRVAIPVTRPVIASFAVISFLAAWNQYTWPRAVVTEGRWETIQIGLRSLSTSTVDQNNISFAAAIIAALPVLALLIFLQRQLIRGLTAGAVKG
ncbi:MAG: carbohydrate ABC transporter permease [Acidimicrobiales bacterium]|jgi:sn-glycerol 3-phosphate transport system permease protein|nr:carbohydrate ABC transporter permease [Acidimicrobiales bacterium]